MLAVIAAAASAPMAELLAADTLPLLRLDHMPPVENGGIVVAVLRRASGLSPLAARAALAVRPPLFGARHGQRDVVGGDPTDGLAVSGHMAARCVLTSAMAGGLACSWEPPARRCFCVLAATAGLDGGGRPGHPPLAREEVVGMAGMRRGTMAFVALRPCPRVMASSIAWEVVGRWSMS